MKTKKFENRIMAKLNEIAEIIRREGKISFGKLCVKAHIAPPTLYNYWRAMRDLFNDIDYEGGIFFVKQRGENHE
ncbi:MAG: hypothetical protein DRJ03_11170 [Chloroflexi bacterium]|nr:MAG: hypothetical protein DRJ03_11170 [Chloroflexota bacterium]